MCLFIETIKLIKGVPQLREYHQERFDDTRRAHFDACKSISLTEVISLPDHLASNRPVKCRIVYGRDIESITYEKYLPKIVRTLRTVFDDDISYTYKSLDRTSLNNLLEQKEGCDEVLIIRNGLVTDTSYSNVVFKDRQGRWFTPDSYLLNGVMRRYLLDARAIGETRIAQEDIRKYQSVKLINAMLGIEDGPEVELPINGKEW